MKWHWLLFPPLVFFVIISFYALICVIKNYIEDSIMRRMGLDKLSDEIKEIKKNFDEEIASLSDQIKRTENLAYQLFPNIKVRVENKQRKKKYFEYYPQKPTYRGSKKRY